MEGGSLPQIRVKVLIIRYLYERTILPYSCMFIHVYTRNRARPSNILEAGEPARKIFCCPNENTFGKIILKRCFSF
jgi:hypothetical protein